MTGFDDWYAITRLITQYGRLADQRRMTEMAELFTPDGRMLMFRARTAAPAEAPQGTAELIEAFGALTAFSATSHVLSPSEVLVDGDAAQAHTYCMSHHIRDTPDGRVRFTLADRYEDALIRVGERWRFQERRKYTDWTESAPLKR
ncbi:nuclear transport factor 2 family protein [Microbacterium panaciterrae]|uniref:Nuclear transport factor 2 family protein n=1 Tax=Microbacterium panaciterrae TaxID=985759 RepID=A0ABP8PKB2_9MICO